MQTYIIYTTKTSSYIVPKENAKLPKQFTHSYEIDSPEVLCEKKTKLPLKITKIEQVGSLLQHLVHEMTPTEIEQAKKIIANN